MRPEKRSSLYFGREIRKIQPYLEIWLGKFGKLGILIRKIRKVHSGN